MLFQQSRNPCRSPALAAWEVPRNQVKDWQFYKFLTNYHELNAKHNQPAQLTGDRDVTAVLDGQQRLTTLTIALTGSYASRIKNRRRSNLAAYPVKKLYIDILGCADETDEQKFYAIQFLTPEEAAAHEGRFWVAFPDLFSKIKNVSDVLMFMAMQRISAAPQERRDFAARTLGMICEALNTQGNVNFFWNARPTSIRCFRFSFGSIAAAQSSAILTCCSP